MLCFTLITQFLECHETRMNSSIEAYDGFYRWML